MERHNDGVHVQAHESGFNNIHATGNSACDDPQRCRRAQSDKLVSKARAWQAYQQPLEVCACLTCESALAASPARA